MLQSDYIFSISRCDAVVMPGMLLVLHCNRYLKNVFGHHHETVLNWKVCVGKSTQCNLLSIIHLTINTKILDTVSQYGTVFLQWSKR